MLKSTMAAAVTAGLVMGAAALEAQSLKVGMITTLSGGGSGLGIDVRDGFMLAIKQAPDADIEVIIEDDLRKPDLAGADRRQDDPVG